MEKKVIKVKFKKPFSIFVVTLLLVSPILVLVGLRIPQVSAPLPTSPPADRPSVFFCSENVSFCTEDNPIVAEVGDSISVALVGFNFTNKNVTDPEHPQVPRSLGNLMGFDVQMSWDPAILELVDYTVATPVEDYPDPVSPSPYPGIMHYPVLEFANITDENDNITNAETGTMAWFSYIAYPPATPFKGDGTFFTMTFNVINPGASALKLNSVALADQSGYKLLWYQYDGRFHTPGAPEANFTFWPDVGVANKTVIFNASDSYSSVNFTIDNYKWDFGDGNSTSVSDSIVHHTYDAIGDYTVSLRVTDQYGTVSSPKAMSLSVVEKRDVKVTDVVIEAVNVLVNRTVGINVTVRNDGRADENFTVTAYYNASEVNFADISTTNWIKIAEKNVSLTKNKDAIVQLVWNTTGVLNATGVPKPNATCYVMANATFVPYEMDTTDNNKISTDPVFILSEPLHDIAVKQIQFGWEKEGAFYDPVLDGEATTVQITIQNAGTENETSVSITLYRNESTWENWTQSLSYGEKRQLVMQEKVSMGYYNISVEATIADDINLENNLANGILHVIELPGLNFTYTPNPAYVNKTVTFDASGSHTTEPNSIITNYKWEMWAPSGGAPEDTFSGATKTNTTYNFTQTGRWRVILYIKDSYGIEYDRTRPATSAYRLEMAIDVKAPSGFPIEYVILIVVIVVAIVAAVVALRIRRRRRQSK